MNHFLHVTSNGGYIGRIIWCNSEDPDTPDGFWGSVALMPSNRWGVLAGSIPLVRYMLR